MTDAELLEIIARHCLSIRRIPLQMINILEGRHRNEHPDGIIILRDIDRKIDGVWRKVPAEFIQLTRVPPHAGWWMCQSLSNSTGSIVSWSEKKHYLAPTLKESVQAFIKAIEDKDLVEAALADAPQEVRDRAKRDLDVYGNAFVMEEDGKYINIDPIKVVTDGSTIKIVGDKEMEAVLCGDMKCIKCGGRTILTICSRCTAKDVRWKKGDK
jgi:hypothetical protein